MIYILSGNIETGKTSALLKWTEARNDVFGILTPRNKNGIRYLLDVNTKESFEMETDLKMADAVTVGRYRFLKSAFEKGNEIIKKALVNNKSGYIIIDELGKLELKSKGFHESALLAIPETINNDDLHLILIIRTTLLLDIIIKYKITDYQFMVIEDLNQPSELS
ncbi:hypothetical protein Q73A0000_16420 [Kaistella flava (ex Peng et al. 2021)]|uniref:Uncharacterized protein n=1 Tax=Kaistella flava (ex Peng et al. 2021) TaxID=2038776 RepID=A0A7M2YCQ7_9FLAO|nr:nucleoside-triphosphatase [Kaistella flava (ex Peng et al. 2021)]QOW11830.1 hypothetical protein Q73A0000_16420 [Kaistella flava (ex Peng et al. 2021)]